MLKGAHGAGTLTAVPSRLGTEVNEDGEGIPDRWRGLSKATEGIFPVNPENGVSGGMSVGAGMWHGER